jgi:hypothetical protein
MPLSSKVPTEIDLRHTRRDVLSIVLVVVALAITSMNCDRSSSVVRRSGIPCTSQGLLRWDEEGDSIVLSYSDMLDSTNWSVVCTAQYCSEDDSSWCAAGGASILKVGSVYYIAVRQRKELGADRGWAWQLWSSTDLATWSMEWEVRRDTVDHDPGINSIEAVSLREFGSVYYLYLSEQDRNIWGIYYVSGASTEELATQLSDYIHWNEIIREGNKDPRVFTYGDDYYMVANTADSVLCGSDFVEKMNVHLMKSPSPTFSTIDTVAWIGEEFWEQWCDSAWDYTAGSMLYDEASGLFIYWGSALKAGASDEVWWVWFGSPDLINWRMLDRKRIDYDTPIGAVSAFRYFDYHTSDDGQMVLIMEGGDTTNNHRDVWLWNLEN